MEYVSDEPEDECHVPFERQDMPVYEENTSGGRTVSEWVKTAQVLLQTPKKKIDKTFKTPEDSAKKKKRFLRLVLSITKMVMFTELLKMREAFVPNSHDIICFATACFISACIWRGIKQLSRWPKHNCVLLLK